MLGQLFAKECKQTAKSLIYWLIVLILIFGFTTQLGNNMEIAKEPKPGRASYGYQASRDPEIIMSRTLGKLTEEYFRGNYTTYPIGFYKNVTLDKEDDHRIKEILKEAAEITGKEEAGRVMEDWYTAQTELKETESGGTEAEDMGPNDVNAGDMMYREPLKIEPAAGLTYERFAELMDEADKILGGGSEYGKDEREMNAEVPKTYEDAKKEYNTLIEKDGLTGGYARLFCDYMGIFLGILPVFLAVTRGMRDRRAVMQELIYTRRCPSLTVVASRYLAMIVMLVLPVLVLSVFPLAKCMNYARTAGITVDMLAFVKYTFGWLMPMIMITAALGMFLTELTDTAAAVLVQGAWWFVAIFGGVQTLRGGMYGWNLVPRHNTEFNWQGYHDGFAQLALNRTLYAAAALLLTLLTAYIYSQKRKGRLQIRGKILANRKSKS